MLPEKHLLEGYDDVYDMAFPIWDQYQLSTNVIPGVELLGW